MFLEDISMDNVLLVTENLILRDLDSADNLDWLEIFSSEKVAQFLVKMDDLEVINRSIAKKINKYKDLAGGSYSVVLKDTDKVIGNLELKIDDQKNWAEISYVFNDKYWNKGYCTESCRALIQYAFDTVGVSKVIADCLSNNSASCHILENKLNMRFVKEEIPEGENKAFKFYEILKSEWK